MKEARPPFFSVIIPVYQCRETIRQCVDSVLSQEKVSCEIILVDDGSTDGSSLLCDEYALRYPEQFRVIHKDNEGPLLARLDGICQAAGEYVLFLDGDDRFSPNALSRIRGALEKYPADLIIIHHVRVGKNGITCGVPTVFDHECVFEGEGMTALRECAVTTDNLNALWQKCVRRTCLSDSEIFRQYGKMVIGEDKLLSLKILEQAECAVYLPDALYQYTVSSDSISHKTSPQHYHDLKLVCCQLMDYVEKWHLNGCRMLCQKRKVELSLTCLRIAVEKVLLHQSRYADYTEIVRCVRKDELFWDAVDFCRNRIGIYQWMLCALVKLQAVRLPFVLIAVYLRLKGLRRYKRD